MGKGKNIAYVRVSTLEQNEARQREALQPYSIDKWFIEEKDLKDIPHEEIPCELTETELLEKLGPGYRRLKDEVYKRLEFVKASFTVKEYHEAVCVSRARENCFYGKRPKKNLFRKRIGKPSLLAKLLNYKYVKAMPTPRHAQDFRRNDCFLASNFPHFHRYDSLKSALYIHAVSKNINTFPKNQGRIRAAIAVEILDFTVMYR